MDINAPYRDVDPATGTPFSPLFRPFRLREMSQSKMKSQLERAQPQS
jgi:hypothetical protein